MVGANSSGPSIVHHGAESFVLSGAGHLLHLEKPRELAEGMAGFFQRHPIDPVGIEHD